MKPHTPISESYWVVDGSLLAGNYPFDRTQPAASQKLGQVLSGGVTCFVDLTVDGEGTLRPYRRHLPKLNVDTGQTVEHHRMPIRDIGIPTYAQMVETLDLIDTKTEEGHIVYVHCWGGIGRTGTVVGCYLMRHGRATRLNVIDKITDLRRNTPKSNVASPETPAQQQMVIDWQE